MAHGGIWTKRNLKKLHFVPGYFSSVSWATDLLQLIHNFLLLPK